MSRFSTRLISAAVTLLKSVPLGKYRLIKPFTCSTEPFSQLWYGSQKKDCAKEQVVYIFRSYGLKVIEKKSAHRILDCEQCDDEFLRGIYDFNFLYIIPTYRIAIDIGFQNI